MRKVIRGAVNTILKPFNLRIISGSEHHTWSHKQSPDIIHSRILTHATYSPWLRDSDFLRCYHAIDSYTLVDIFRCYELWHIAKQLSAVQGNVLEVGTWRGGSGCLLAKAVEPFNKTVFLADTFTGVVKASDRDTVYRGGEHSDASAETVRRLTDSMHLTNVVLLPGIFPDETAGQVQLPLSLVHCDVDVYESAKGVLEWVTPRLSPGAVIVLDDYGYSGCEGITRLVNELYSSLPSYLLIYNLNGHAILHKAC